jgi:hypothetical protein
VAGKPEIGIDALVANPSRASDLTAVERHLVIQRCAAVILLVSRQEPDTGIPITERQPRANTKNQSELITVLELARIMKVAPGTVKNRLGKLGEADGVVRWGSKCTRINWPLFLDRLSKGKLGSTA